MDLIGLVIISTFLAFGIGTVLLIKSTITQFKEIQIHQVNLKKNFQRQKDAKTIPKTFLPVSKFKEATESDLMDSEMLYLAILEQSEEGKLKFSTSELSLGMNSYRQLLKSYIEFKKRPVLICIGLILFLPVSWVGLLFLGLAYAYYSSQVGKMEMIFTQFLNGSATLTPDRKTASNIISLTAEIQRLEELRAKGVINEVEFSELKKKLISA
jgi:hypothetical protein